MFLFFCTVYVLLFGLDGIFDSMFEVHYFLHTQWVAPYTFAKEGHYVKFRLYYSMLWLSFIIIKFENEYFIWNRRSKMKSYKQNWR